MNVIKRDYLLKQIIMIFLRFFMLCVISITFQNMNAQVMAHNTKTANTTNASAIIMSEMKEAMPSAELYDYTWNTYNAHAKTTTVPSTYKIDLRDFSMPIEHNFITSNFGRRWNRNHNGIDLKAYLGDTIYAAFSGKVRVVRYNQGGYGNFIVIRHHNGLETVYGHLSKQIVKVNEDVKAGQPIGLAGNTGRSTGTHLHFETRFCGIPINPLEIFSFKERDVTDDFYTWKKK